MIHGPWARGHMAWAMGPGPWALCHGPWAMGPGPWLHAHMPIHTCPHAYTPKVVLDKTCQTGFGSSETGSTMPRQTGFDDTGFSETGFVTAILETGFGYRFPVRFEVIVSLFNRFMYFFGARCRRIDGGYRDSRM